MCVILLAVLFYSDTQRQKECSSLAIGYSKVKVTKIALASYPGAGNTWLRHLIEHTSGMYIIELYISSQKNGNYWNKCTNICRMVNSVSTSYVTNRQKDEQTEVHHGFIHLVPYYLLSTKFIIWRWMNSTSTGDNKNNLRVDIIFFLQYWYQHRAQRIFVFSKR